MDGRKHNKTFAGLITRVEGSVETIMPDDLILNNKSGIHFWTSEVFQDFPFTVGHLSRKDALDVMSKVRSKETFVKNGKWSFVHFDEGAQKLYLVRDVPGISPLYYQIGKEAISFSNDLSLMKTMTEESWKMNYSSVVDFLIYDKIDHSEQTLIQGINEVMPGHFLEIDIQALHMQSHRYFDYTKYNQEVKRNFSDTISLNRASILDYFTQWKDVCDQHTVLLSGGLDSSVITCALDLKEVPKVSMITASYPGYPFDEVHWAGEVSRAFPGYRWESIYPNGESFIGDVEHMHRIIDFPTFSTGTYNQFSLLKKASENGSSLVWDGLGADALYGGHDYYRHWLFFQYCRKMNLTKANELLRWKGNYMEELWATLKTRIRSNAKLIGLINRWYLKGPTENNRIYSPQFIEYIRDTKEGQSRQKINVREMMLSDFFNNGVRHLSRFSDRIGEYFGLDMVYPFAENIQLALAISQLPVELRFQNGVSKAVLRESFRSELPNRIYERRTKLGMQSPNNQWITDHADIWKSYLMEYGGGIYDTDYIDQYFHDIWCHPERQENYRLFKHISFAIWKKVHEVS